jgi:cellulose synthase/poly-beta-1,6-N-acetylglucosamine synthase-like glycosyltransferase
MRASIIISTYSLERLQDLKGSISSLAKQNLDDVEVLLIPENDAALVNGLKKEFKDKPVKVLVSDKKGLTSARNMGIEKSTGDIVIFLDDDAVPGETWLEELLEPFKDKTVLAVGGGVVPKWEKKRPKWFPEELNWLVGCYYKGHPTKPAFVRNVIGANMAFRREIFSKTGMFSTNIGAIGKKRIAGDDSEFGMRIREWYGHNRILYVPSAPVMHTVPRARESLGYTFKRAYVEGASKAVIAKMSRKKSKRLDTEQDHLKYLLAKGIPSKIKEFKIGEFVALASCTLLVLIGYARGKLIRVKGVL